MSQLIIDALIRGSVLALMALGLTVVQGTLGFANVAHLEMATAGAYLTVAFTNAGVGLLASALLSVAATAVFAVVLYRLVFRRLLRSSPLVAMIGSLSLSIVIRALFQLLFGSQPRPLPTALQQAISIEGGFITPSQVRLVVIAILMCSATLGLLRWTPLGRRVRAVAANGPLAAASGINRARVIDMVWVLAAVLAATAGILLALESAASPDIGFNELLPVFAVAILGGLGSPGGAVAAAFLVALLESTVLRMHFGWLTGSDSQLPVSYRPAIAFVVLIVVLLVRPQGLLGRTGRRA